MKVLLVDDNEKIRAMIRMYINGFADEIVECHDGEEAISAYHRLQPDWVLMDIVMPHLDGITATKRIRESYPDARVIIVSQYDDAAFRESARRAGACGYILKENLSAIQQLIGTANEIHQ